MVCVSCIVVPLVLWLWHRFLQPIFLKIYNPWGKVEAKTEGDAANGSVPTDAPAAPAKCPFTSSSGGAEAVAAEASDTKKTD